MDFTRSLRAVLWRPDPSPGAKRAYHADIPAFRRCRPMRSGLSRAPATFLAGENGSGKSALRVTVAIAAGSIPGAAPGSSAFQRRKRARRSMRNCDARAARFASGTERMAVARLCASAR